MSFELVKELQVRHCILIQSQKTKDLISSVKIFSSEYIPTTYLSYDSLIEYIQSTETIYFHTGLIFKEDDLDVLEDILLAFNEVEENYKLRNFIWLTFLENDTQTFQNHHLNIPYDCEFIVIQPLNETAYKLTEIYMVKNKSFSLDFGAWDRDYGLQAPSISFYIRRIDFQNTEMQVHSYSGFEEYDQSKYGILTISALAEMTNLTYLSRSIDGSILEESNDISIHLLFYSYTEYTDKLAPISVEIVNWCIKYPVTELRSDYYLMPFNTHQWLLLLSIVIIGTWSIIIIQNRIRKKRPLIDDIFLGMESFCNQCGNDDIENAYIRFICILLRINSVILIAGLYGATITTFFAMERFEPPFTNREGFVGNGDYKIIVPEPYIMSFLALLMVHNKNDINTLIAKNLTKSINAYKFEELYEKICYEKYALPYFNDGPDPLNIPCRIYTIPDYLGKIWNGIVLKKNSPFTKILDVTQVRFLENGLLQLWATWYGETVYVTTLKVNLKDSDDLKDSIEPITIEQMIQVLSIPLIGILLGVAIIMIECIKKHRCLQKYRSNFFFSKNYF